MIIVMVFLIAFAASQSVGSCLINEEPPQNQTNVDEGGSLYICVSLDDI